MLARLVGTSGDVQEMELHLDADFVPADVVLPFDETTDGVVVRRLVRRYTLARTEEGLATYLEVARPEATGTAT